MLTINDLLNIYEEIATQKAEHKIYKDPIDNAMDVVRFFAENNNAIDKLSEDGLMEHFGITRKLVLRQFHWLCRAVAIYNHVVALLVYHLKKLSASAEDIDAVLTILKKYEEK